MFCGEMQCGRRLGLGPNPNFAVITGASKHTVQHRLYPLAPIRYN